MLDFLADLFDPSDFPPRWECGTWTAAQGWLHILSDLGVWSAYVAIPCVLAYFVLRGRDIPFRTIFLLFGAFILACGTTHLMEAIIFWWPAYRLAGVIKLFTALVSWATVFALVRVTPEALAMRSPIELAREVEARRKAEEALRQANAELEHRVRERTEELAMAVTSLRTEVAVRSAVEKRLLESREQLRLVTDHAPVFLFQCDAELRYKFANAPYARRFGLEPTDVVGKHFAEVVGRENHERLRDRFDSALAGQRMEFDIELSYPALGPRWMHCVYVPEPGESGEVRGFVAALNDVTARVRVAEALRASERRYRALVNSTPQIVWAVGGTDDGAKAWWSELTGQTPEESAGLKWLEAVHPDDRERVRETWVHAFETLALYDTEYRIRTRAGEYRHFIVRGVPLLGPDGSEPEWIGTLTDITGKKQAEAALLESERRFRQLADAMPQIVWAARPDGTVDYYNRRCFELTGADEIATGDQSWLPIMHPDDRQKSLDLWYASVQTGQPYQIEYRFRFPATNEYRWHLGRALPVRDERGGITRWFGTSTDIQDQKKAECDLRDLNATLEQRVDERTRELREQEERFRSAFDDAPIGIALVSPGGKWLQVNRSLCEIIGYTEAELLATDFQSITHPDDLALNLDHYRRMLAGTIRTYQMEKRYLHKAGHFVHSLLSVSLVRDSAGEPLYFISQVKDITQRKQDEARLKASLHEKEVLLKEIHHRVKNNLQIVSTLLDLQSDHTQDRQAIQMFEESRGRVKSMALIHERLYRSPDLAGVDFAEYISQLADDLYHSYKVSGDEIVLEVAVDVPPLPIDIAIPCGLLLNELMSNCLKHAFRDATEGRIRVSLRREGVGIALTVADDGAGFPPDLDFRDTTSFGMQLVNTLVEQLAGVVELKNDRGTEFTVTFPHKR